MRNSFFIKQLNYFLCFLCVSAASICNAQNYNYKNYNISDGLAGTTVYQVFQDSRKYIWLATEHGVSCFDGNTFRNYTMANGLPDNEVFAVNEDSRGRIWFSTNNGTPAYFYKDTIVSFARNPAFKKLNINSFITSFHEDHAHNIWLGTFRNDVIKITAGGAVYNYRYIHADHSAFKTIENKKGEIFTLAREEIYRTNDKKNVYTFPFREGMVYPRFCNLSADSFIFSNHNGIFLWNNELKKPPLHLFNIPDLASVLYMAADTGAYYLCTDKGVYVISRASRQVVAHWLEHKAVSSILTDHENNTWISTLNEGVFFRSSYSNMFRPFNEQEDVKGKSVSAIMKDNKGSIWIAARNKLIVFHAKGECEKFAFEKTSSDERFKVNSIVQNTNTDIWCGTANGTSVFKNGNLSGSYPFFAAKFITHDAKGSMYISCTDGIYIIDRNFNVDSIFMPRVNTIEIDKNERAWIGRNNGLFRLAAHKLVDYTGINSFLTAKIKSIAADSAGNLWLATDGWGLIRCTPDFKDIISINTKNGLTSDICKKVICNKNMLWLITNKGISSIHAQNGQYQIKNYTVQNGLPCSGINDLLLSHDTLYIATDKGVYFFNPWLARQDKTAPPVYISCVYVNDQKISFTNPLTLPSGQKKITVNFSGISYNSGKELLYKYKNSIDTGWNYTTQRTVRYDYLPGGQYTFQVYARSLQGIWSDKPAVLNFTIAKYYWETSWFRIAAALAAALILFLVYKLAVKITEKRAFLVQRVNESEQKALRAQMNPHFIFNALNSIQQFILNNNQEAAHRYLSMFGKLMRRILDNSSSSYISLEEEIQSLTLYLKLEAMRMENKFNYGFYIDNQINTHTTLIPSMVIQPYVENAVWHGIAPLKGNGFISIQLTLTEEDIVCIIQDNGIGRKQSAAYKSKHAHASTGMNATAERLELLKTRKRNISSVHITDLLDKDGNPAGTEIRLLLSSKKTYEHA